MFLHNGRYPWWTPVAVDNLHPTEETFESLSNHIAAVFNGIQFPMFHKQNKLFFPDEEEARAVPDYMMHTARAIHYFYLMNKSLAPLSLDTTSDTADYHVGLAASLIRSVAFGFYDPQFRVDQEHLEYSTLSALQVKVTRFETVFLPVIRYFVEFLNPKGHLTEENLLEVSIPTFQEELKERVREAGAWSPVGIQTVWAKELFPAGPRSLEVENLYLQLRDLVMIVAIPLPIATLASRVVPGFSAAFDDGYNNGDHGKLLTPSEFAQGILRPSDGNSDKFCF